MQNYFFVWVDRKFKRLKFSEILYVESLKNYIRIVTIKGNYMISITMKEIEKILPKNQFCRIHRSYIISLENISCFDNDSLNIDDKKFPISETYRQLLLDRVITLKSAPRISTGFSNKSSDNILKNWN